MDEPPSPSPPPPPLSQTTMDSLARVDLATLRSDTVLVYADRVMQLSPSKVNTQEKLQMLLVLSQKLLRWFLDDRREAERLREALQETLLAALQSASTNPNVSTHSIDMSQKENEVDTQSQPEYVDEDLDASTTQATGYETIECVEQVEAEMYEEVEHEVEEHQYSTYAVEAETEIGTLVCSQCREQNQRKTAECGAQTDVDQQSEMTEAESQTNTPATSGECSVQVSADTTENMVQTDATECGTPIETQTELPAVRAEDSIHVEPSACHESEQPGADQRKVSLAETQTESLASAVDYGTQVEAITVNGEVQTDPYQQLSSMAETQTELHGASTDSGIQVEATTDVGYVQTDFGFGLCVAETQTASAAAIEWGIQVEVSTVDSDVQTNAGGELVDSSTQDDKTCTVESGDQTDPCAELVDSSTQEATTPTIDNGSQTNPGVELVDSSSQSDEIATVDKGAQASRGAELVDSSTQDETIATEAITQTDPAGDVVSYGVQVEIKALAAEEGVQTEAVAQLDNAVQTAVDLSTTGAQTWTQEIVDNGVQTVSEMVTHETSTRDEFDSAELAVQTNDADWVEVPLPLTNTRQLPIDVYFEVHRSIVRLQRIVRGYMTRRRFYRMLNELVNAK